MAVLSLKIIRSFLRIVLCRLKKGKKKKTNERKRRKDEKEKEKDEQRTEIRRIWNVSLDKIENKFENKLIKRWN